MGNYNPDRPTILGMEWVPLAQNNRVLDLQSEIGYSFTVSGAPNNFVDSVTDWYSSLPNQLQLKPILWSIYPEGREADVGEIRTLRLTVATTFVTGATQVGTTPYINAPTDNEYVQFTSLNDRLQVEFNTVVPTLNPLTGKRILGVDMEYQIAGTPGFSMEPAIGIASMGVRYPYGPVMTGPATLAEVAQPGVIRLGDVNPFWNTAGGPNTDVDRFPWIPSAIQRLGNLAPRLFLDFRLISLPLSGVVRLGYIQLVIYYCEENRVAVGGTVMGQDLSGALAAGFSGPLSQADMRDPLTLASGAVTLPAGRYTITKTAADGGDKYNAGTVEAHGIYQLNELSSHPGIEVTKFIRPTGGQPAIEPTAKKIDTIYSALPMAVTNTTALTNGVAPFTYLNQLGAPVYRTPGGVSITAVQQVRNQAVPSRASYDFVRFYARRFNPGAPGDLNIALAGSGSVTITPEEFVALDELTADGWKEITLPYATTFTADGSFRNVTFSMTGVTTSKPSDQWQILGARATNNANLNVAGYPDSIYDAPNPATLTWKSPIVSGSTPVSDVFSTATVMFAQAAGPLTTFAVTGSGCEIDLEPIARNCDFVPACIPTKILGNKLAWPAVVLDTYDNFARSVAAGGLGTATSGQVWAVSNAPATNWSVNGLQGVNSINALAVRNIATIDGPILNGRVYGEVTVPALALTQSYELAVTGRKTADGNYYAAGIRFETSGLITLRLTKFTGGVGSVISSVATTSIYTAGSKFSILFEFVGTALRMKAWLTDIEDEPLFWQTEALDSDHTSGSVGLVDTITAGNTNTLPFQILWDNFSAMSITPMFGYYEIQRQDPISSDQDVIGLDTFSRTVSGSWGDSEALDLCIETPALPWELLGGSPLEYSVNGSAGLMSMNSAVLSNRRAFLDVGSQGVEVYGEFTIPVVALGDRISARIGAQFDATNMNGFEVRLDFEASGVADLNFTKVTNGTPIAILSGVTAGAYSAGDRWGILFRTVGQELRASAWNITQSGGEPDTWQMSATDVEFYTGTYIKLQTDVGGSNTNTFPVVPQWDNFRARSIVDIDENGWETIAKITDESIREMCDFEARACIESVYRIRAVDELGFPGEWSQNLGGILASPGVSGVGDGNSVLVFTSNQDPSKSLAYVMQFEGDPEEEFNFPEAGFTQLRTEYQRDYFTAFRPLERGGETFEREILVHAAAIPPKSLANFRGFRDLAWAALPYVCVRDELGNRWLANVLVPSGRVRNNRSIYIAKFQLTEVTNTPAPYTGE